MKKYGLLFTIIFFIGFGISVSFQSCGSSSVQANKAANGDGLQVQVVPNDPNNSDDDDGGGGSTGGGDDEEPGDAVFSFNLGRGDNIFYRTQNTAVNVLSTARVLAKSYYTIFESHIYESTDVQINSDLPTNYCNNSALPHCAHQNPFVCMGFGCFEGPTPVRCHWQKRMTSADVNNTFPTINSLVFLTRQVTPEDPMIDGCNDPVLAFYRESSDVIVSLANRACVPNEMYYATAETGPNLIDLFNDEINNVAQLTDNGGGSEYCNNYSVYAWDTTKFSYESRSGFVPQAQSYFYEVSYEAQFATMRWKVPGDDQIYCATQVPIQPSEMNTLFPDTGLNYEVLRTNVAVADLPTAHITYEDPIDGGSVWRFYMNRGTALTFGGGAIMNEAQADAIQELIENVLPNRAGAFNRVTNCN